MSGRRYDNHLNRAWTRPVGVEPDQVAGAPTYGVLVMAHLGLAFVLANLSALLLPLGDRSVPAQIAASFALAALTAVVGGVMTAPQRPVLSRILGGFVLAGAVWYLASGVLGAAVEADWPDNQAAFAAAAAAFALAVPLWAWRRGWWLLVALTGAASALAVTSVGLREDAPREAYGAALFIVAAIVGGLAAARVARPARHAYALAALVAGAGGVVVSSGRTGAAGQLVGLVVLVALAATAWATRSGAVVLLLSLVGPYVIGSVLWSSGAPKAVPTAMVAGGFLSALLAADVERRSPERHRLGGVYAWSGLLVIVGAEWLVTDPSALLAAVAVVGLVGLLVAATSARRRVLVVFTSLALIGVVPAKFADMPEDATARAAIMILVGAVVLAIAVKLRPPPRPAAMSAATGELPPGEWAQDTLPAPYAEVVDSCVAVLASWGALEFVDRAAGRVAGSGIGVAVWQQHASEPTRIAASGDPARARALLAAVRERLVPAEQPAPVEQPGAAPPYGR